MDTLSFWQHSFYSMPWWQSILLFIVLAVAVLAILRIFKINPWK